MAASAASSCSAQSQSQAPYTSLVMHDECTRARSGERPVMSPVATATAGWPVLRLWKRWARKRPCTVSSGRSSSASREPSMAGLIACASSGLPWIVLLGLHDLEVGDEGVEVLRGEVFVRRHVPVPEDGWIPDVCFYLLDRAILDDALRDVEIGSDLAALAVDGMAGDALVAEEVEPCPCGRVVGHVARHRVRVAARQIRDLDRVQLVRPGIDVGVPLGRFGPHEVERPGVESLATERREARGPVGV